MACTTGIQLKNPETPSTPRCTEIWWDEGAVCLESASGSTCIISVMLPGGTAHYDTAFQKNVEKTFTEGSYTYSITVTSIFAQTATKLVSLTACSEGLDTLAISSVTATTKGTAIPQQVEMNVNFTGSSPKKRYVKLTYGNEAETLDIPAGVLKVGVTRYFNPGQYNICAILI